MKNVLPLLLCLALASCTTLPDETPEAVTFTGTLLGHDGAPMRGARVSVGDSVATAGPDGRYTLVLPKPRPYYMWVTGVLHRTTLVPLYVDAYGTVELDLRLAAPAYVDTFGVVQVVGPFNDYDDDEGGYALERGADGVYRGVVPAPADTFAYRLTGVQTDDYTIEPPGAPRYVPTSGTIYSNRAGKYAAVVEAPGDSVEIVFDPADLPRGDAPLHVAFADTTSRTARVAALHARFDRYGDAFRVAHQAHRNAGGDPRAFRYDWSAARAEVAALIDAEPDSVLRRYLLLNYFSSLGPAPSDSLLARRALAELPPRSPLWTMVWGLPTNAFARIDRIAAQPEMVRAYARRVVDEHPVEGVRAAFLSYEVSVAYRAMDAQRQALATAEDGGNDAARTFSILYDRLQSEYGDTWHAENARRDYAPDRAVQAGNPVPAFDLVALADSTVRITPAALGGRVYLIEFWAVWCGPCVGEMEYLHEAYETYRDRGFEIVSVSFDDHPRDVAAFRAGEWPMPWRHAFVPDGFESAIAEAFEIVGIPKPILVGEDGVILATAQDLRREKLHETLAAVFENRTLTAGR